MVMATDSKNADNPPFWPFLRGDEGSARTSSERLDKVLVAAWIALVATIIVDALASRF